jgi:hypothetical protein
LRHFCSACPENNRSQKPSRGPIAFAEQLRPRFRGIEQTSSENELGLEIQNWNKEGRALFFTFA